jgi:class 3 adenylate cyclase
VLVFGFVVVRGGGIHHCPTPRTSSGVLYEDLLAPIEQTRYLADNLPDARLLLSDGGAAPNSEPVGRDPPEVAAFVTRARQGAPATDRVLATALFTDIVASTQRAATEGDRRWRTLLESHDTIASRRGWTSTVGDSSS